MGVSGAPGEGEPADPIWGDALGSPGPHPRPTGASPLPVALPSPSATGRPGAERARDGSAPDAARSRPQGGGAAGRHQGELPTVGGGLAVGGEAGVGRRVRCRGVGGEVRRRADRTHSRPSLVFLLLPPRFLPVACVIRGQLAAGLPCAEAMPPRARVRVSSPEVNVIVEVERSRRPFRSDETSYPAPFEPSCCFYNGCRGKTIPY